MTDLLALAQAKEVSGRSRTTLLRAIHSMRLPAQRCGSGSGKFLVSRAALLRLMAASMYRPLDETPDGITTHDFDTARRLALREMRASR